MQLWIGMIYWYIPLLIAWRNVTWGLRVGTPKKWFKTSTRHFPELPGPHPLCSAITCKVKLRLRCKMPDFWLYFWARPFLLHNYLFKIINMAMWVASPHQLANLFVMLSFILLDENSNFLNFSVMMKPTPCEWYINKSRMMGLLHQP